MTEKNYYNGLTKFYEKDALITGRSSVWDAKFTRTNSLAFSCLSTHQEDRMVRAERAFGYKIPDAGQAQKPFDGFSIAYAKSFIPIIFYEPRKTTIYEVPLGSFIHERETGKRKSLTKERAKEICTRIIKI